MNALCTSMFITDKSSCISTWNIRRFSSASTKSSYPCAISRLTLSQSIDSNRNRPCIRFSWTSQFRPKFGESLKTWTSRIYRRDWYGAKMSSGSVRRRLEPTLAWYEIFPTWILESSWKKSFFLQVSGLSVRLTAGRWKSYQLLVLSDSPDIDREMRNFLDILKGFNINITERPIDVVADAGVALGETIEDELNGLPNSVRYSFDVCLAHGYL